MTKFYNKLRKMNATTNSTITKAMFDKELKLKIEGNLPLEHETYLGEIAKAYEDSNCELPQ